MTMFTSSSDSLFHPTISASSGATGVPALASVAAPAASNLHPSTNSVSYGTHVEAPGTGVHSPALSPPPQSATRPPSRNGSKARARNRRVELSRIARSVMYDMMGLTSSSDPLPAWDAEHPKVTESATGKVTWRWDWSRTVLGSSHNRSFVDAIQETIERERQNPSSVQLLVAIQSVPQEDWGHLRQAIESAYGNLRREYESRWDVSVMQTPGRVYCLILIPSDIRKASERRSSTTSARTDTEDSRKRSKSVGRRRGRHCKVTLISMPHYPPLGCPMRVLWMLHWISNTCLQKSRT